MRTQPPRTFAIAPSKRGTSSSVPQNVTDLRGVLRRQLSDARNVDEAMNAAQRLLKKFPDDAELAGRIARNQPYSYTDRGRVLVVRIGAVQMKFAAELLMTAAEKVQYVTDVLRWGKPRQ